MNVAINNAQEKLNEMSLLVSMIKYGYDRTLKNVTKDDKVFVMLRNRKTTDELIAEYEQMILVLQNCEE